MLILTHDGEYVNSDRLLRYYCIEGKFSNISTIYAEADPDYCVVLARYYTHDRAFQEMLKLCEAISQEKPGIYVIPDDEEETDNDDNQKV